ncbi:MAG: HDIG domain-containing metalloprotein [Thermoplasmatota archaeon]
MPPTSKKSLPLSCPPESRRRAWRFLTSQPTLPEWVLGHSLAVEALAAAWCELAFARGLPIDPEIVQVGALLHDVGRSVTQSVRHAGVGAQLVRDGGWDEGVALVVERHTGAGIDLGEALALGLPARDYTPRTLEERAVAHADNLFSASRRLTLAQALRKYEDKGLGAAAAKLAALHAALGSELGCELDGTVSHPLPMP